MAHKCICGQRCECGDPIRYHEPSDKIFCGVLYMPEIEHTLTTKEYKKLSKAQQEVFVKAGRNKWVVDFCLFERLTLTDNADLLDALSGRSTC